MIKWNGKNYYNPKQAVKKFNVAESSLYHWSTTKQVELLDIEEFCNKNPLETDDLIAKYYIAENDLIERGK